MATTVSTRARPRLSALEAALGALSRRALSEAEVRGHLARRGYSEDEVDGAVAQLRTWRYLDDAGLANHVAGRAAARAVGRARASRELARRGVEPETLSAAVDRSYAGRDAELLERALEQALRGMGGVRSAKEVARLARRLVTRGFEPDMVFERLRDVGPGIDSDL